MATGADASRETGAAATILIELEVGRVDRLDRPLSRWTALVIAFFTALTCLGLGASVVLPRQMRQSVSARSGQPSL